MYECMDGSHALPDVEMDAATSLWRFVFVMKTMREQIANILLMEKVCFLISNPLLHSKTTFIRY